MRATGFPHGQGAGGASGAVRASQRRCGDFRVNAAAVTWLVAVAALLAYFFVDRESARRNATGDAFAWRAARWTVGSAAILLILLATGLTHA